jgi:hypothetical protein
MRNVGPFVSALGQMFMGYSQDQEAKRQRERQTGLDAQNAQLHAAQLAHVNAQTAELNAPKLPKPPEFEEMVDADGTVYLRNKLDPNDIRKTPIRRPVKTESEPLEVTMGPNGQRVYTPRSKAVGMQAPAPASQGDSASEQRKFLRTQGLQGDYKANETVKKAYGTAGAVSGLKAALAGDSPMDDLAVIYETVKLFDPGSVVKEGEIKLTQSANSLPGQVQVLVEGWKSGRKLTPQMRQAIQELVDRKVTESRNAVAPVQSEAGAMARRYGVEADSAYIAPDPFRGVAPTPKPMGDTRQTGRLAPVQVQRAAVDSTYKAFLKATGKLKP